MRLYDTLIRQLPKQLTYDHCTFSIGTDYKIDQEHALSLKLN